MVILKPFIIPMQELPRMIQYNAPLIIMLFMCFKNKILPKKIELIALFLILFALFLLITNGDINALKLDIRGVIWAFLELLEWHFIL